MIALLAQAAPDTTRVLNDSSQLVSELGIAAAAFVCVFMVVFIMSRLMRRRSRLDELGGSLNTFDFERLKRVGLMTDDEFAEVKAKARKAAREKITGFPTPAAEPRKLSAEEMLRELDERIEREGLAALEDARKTAEARKLAMKPHPVAAGAEPAAPNETHQHDDAMEDRLALLARAATNDRGEEPAVESQRPRPTPRDAREDEIPDEFDPMWAMTTKPSDGLHLDKMLREGVITHEEYQRMKAWEALRRDR